MNDTKIGVMVAKGALTTLTLDEADVYFESAWYKEQIKQKRHKLIETGVVKVGGYHENNPEDIQHLFPKKVERVAGGPIVLPLPIIRK